MKNPAQSIRPSIPFNIRLDPDVYWALVARHETSGKTKTEIVDHALRRELRNELLDRKEPKNGR